MLEHAALGAGSYSAFFAIDHEQHYSVGLSGAAAVGVAKELLGDWHNGKDSFWMAVLHTVEIVGGAGAVAAAWH